MTLQLHTGSRTVIGADFLVGTCPAGSSSPTRGSCGRRGRCWAGSSPSWTGSPGPPAVAAAPRRSTRHPPARSPTAPPHRPGQRRRPPPPGRPRRSGDRPRSPTSPPPSAPSPTAVAVRRAEAVAEAARCGVLVAIGGDLAVSGLAPVGGWRVALPTASETVPTVLGHHRRCAVHGRAAHPWPAAQARRHRHGAPGRAGVAPRRRARCHRTRRQRRRLRRTAARRRRGHRLAGCGLGARLVDAGGGGTRRPLLARPHRHPQRARPGPSDRPQPRPGVAWDRVPHDLPLGPPDTVGALRASGHTLRVGQGRDPRQPARRAAAPAATRGRASSASAPPCSRSWSGP